MEDYKIDPLRKRANNDDHSTLAVLESRVDTLEKVVNGLVSFSENMRSVVSNLTQSIALQQQSQSDMVKDASDTIAKVSELSRNQQMVKGGWLALTIVCGLIVGLATLLGVFISYAAMKK